MSRKEELQKELAEIEKQEEARIMKEAYPEFQKLIGKCFKQQDSYSCPSKESDYWNTYRKIVSIREEAVYMSVSNQHLSSCIVMEFHTDKYGRIYIHSEHRVYTHILGEEISEEEFNHAFERVFANINALRSPSFIAEDSQTKEI